MNPPPPIDQEQPQSTARSLRSAMITAGKLVLSALLVWWLWRSGRLDFSRLSSIRLGAAFWSMVILQALMLGCIAARWHCLVRACGLGFSWKESLRISFIGHFAAVWTPAGLGLDGVRLWEARRLARHNLRAVTMSTVCDRLLGLWALIALTAVGCLVLVTTSGSIGASSAQHMLMVLGCVCAVFTVVPLLFFKWVKAAFHKRWGESIALQSDKKPWLAAAALAVATHLCNFASLLFALRVLNGETLTMPTLLTAPAVVLSSLIPLTPLGLGVTDAAASALFHAVGVASGAEATMLGRVTFVLLSALCGLAWLWPSSPNT